MRSPRRPIALTALLPLVLATLVAVTAATASAAPTGRATLSTSAYAGDLPSEKTYRTIDEPLTGSFSRSLPTAGASGADGSASSSASLTVTAGPQSIAMHGAGAATSNRPDGKFASGGASASYELNGWVVPASGRWQVKLEMRSTGTESGSNCGLTTASVMLGHYPIVNELYYCNDPLQDRTESITLKAGDTLKIKGSAQSGAKNGTSQGSWTITIKPISLDKPTAKNAPKPMAAPKITGKPKAGKTLTATKGVWKNRPTAFAFQWLRKGKPITGATGSTYKVKKADKGKKISVRVTAANKDGRTTATSKAVKIKKGKKK